MEISIISNTGFILFDNILWVFNERESDVTKWLMAVIHYASYPPLKLFNHSSGLIPFQLLFAL
jgi:hypothetical protein